MAIGKVLFTLLVGVVMGGIPHRGALAHMPASPPATQSKQCILVDITTGEGKVLFEKSPDELIHPSSMTKIMTVYLVFQRLKSGRLKMEDTLPVSKEAWKMQGSKMFVDINSSVSISDLLRGTIVQSGNDATVVLAEGLGGTEAEFASEMTRVARQMGAKDSTFMNASGWPDPYHRSTVRNLAIIAMRTIQDFPEYFPLYSEKEFTYHGIRQSNRNPLLYTGLKADGLKTGHTEAGGYGLVASATQNGRKLVLVATGYKSMDERAKDTEMLMHWGFRETKLVPLYKAYAEVTKTGVWQGVSPTVSLVSPKALAMVVPRSVAQDMKVDILYHSQVKAPVKKGTMAGKLVVTIPGMPLLEYPLVTGEDVPLAGLWARAMTGVASFLSGKGRGEE
jgi:D-alanyl-D-alanine carboxypeptidase (penicillin-binding protein 5/6)